MYSLKKHELDFITAKEYLIEILDDANILSKELFSLVRFEKGHFFTLLPEKANIEQLHNFKSGAILPQNPEKEYFINERSATYSEIPNLNGEVAELILDEIISNNYIWIADDVIRLAIDNSYSNLLKEKTFFFENEVYYFINNHSASKEIIIKCLQASTAIWHSLSLLTKLSNLPASKKLNLETIQKICINVQVMIIGAYDGEGYIFWEKVL